MKVKKGSAIGLTICIIFITAFLAAGLISLAISTTTETSEYAKRNKLRLIARSGIDKAEAKLAEIPVVWNPTTMKYDITWSSLKYADKHLTFTENGGSSADVTCSVILNTDDPLQPSITSTAKIDGKTTSETITVTLNGDDLIGDKGYVKKIPYNGLTVIGDYKSGAYSISIPADTGENDFKVDGDTFIQAGIVKKQSTFIKYLMGAYSKTSTENLHSGTPQSLAIDDSGADSVYGTIIKQNPQKMLGVVDEPVMETDLSASGGSLDTEDTYGGDEHVENFFNVLSYTTTTNSGLIPGFTTSDVGKSKISEVSFPYKGIDTCKKRIKLTQITSSQYLREEAIGDPTAQYIYGSYLFPYDSGAGSTMKERVAVIKVKQNPQKPIDFDSLYRAVYAKHPLLFCHDNLDTKNYAWDLPYKIFIFDGDTTVTGCQPTGSGQFYPHCIIYVNGKFTVQGSVSLDNSSLCCKSLLLKDTVVGGVTQKAVFTIYKPDGDHHHVQDGVYLERVNVVGDPNDYMPITKDSFTDGFYHAYSSTRFNNVNARTFNGHSTGTITTLKKEFDIKFPYYNNVTDQCYSNEDIKTDFYRANKVYATDLPTPYYFSTTANSQNNEVLRDYVDNEYYPVDCFLKNILDHSLKILKDNLRNDPEMQMFRWDEQYTR